MCVGVLFSSPRRLKSGMPTWGVDSVLHSAGSGENAAAFRRASRRRECTDRCTAPPARQCGWEARARRPLW